MKAHRLARWIDGRMSRAAFAAKAKISESHLSTLISGKRGASLDLASRIESLTGGDVPASVMASEHRRTQGSR